MERATGIEPAFTAWEAVVLPMNYARKAQKRSLSMSHILLVEKSRAAGFVLFLRCCAENDTLCRFLIGTALLRDGSFSVWCFAD